MGGDAVKFGKLPANQKLWRVRLDYPSEGGEVATTRSVLLTYNGAVAFRQEMARDRPDIKSTMEVDAAAVAKWEEDKALKRVEAKRNKAGNA